ncbi:hypothetical protein PRUPE_1G066900 [Prunus persica]|uniref:Uncharacterized protein n=2 Tax=Prunus persica TaxID=3760 RepID=A0A251QUG3_PRUPE|nr:hypothetical protein PRUPE_1G066900 [Prunus persica]
MANARISDIMGLKGGVIPLGFAALVMFSCVADDLSGEYLWGRVSVEALPRMTLLR